MSEKIVFILDGLKFDWTKRQLNRITHLWNEGYSINVIKKEFKHVNNLGVKNIDVVLAIMHLELEGKIKSRPGGLLGTKEEIEV